MYVPNSVINCWCNDVTKTLALDCDKEIIPPFISKFLLVRNETYLPSPSWSVLSLIFEPLLQCSGKVWVRGERPVSVIQALCSSVERTCPLCRYLTLGNICSQEQKDPVERHLFNWHIFNYVWWIKLTFRNTRLGWHRSQSFYFFSVCVYTKGAVSRVRSYCLWPGRCCSRGARCAHAEPRTERGRQRCQGAGAGNTVIFLTLLRHFTDLKGYAGL